MCENYIISKKDNRENVIYGAGTFGQMFLQFLQRLDVPVHFFCQTETDGNRMEMNGIPIISFDELKKHNTDKNIFIALYNKEISNKIRQMVQTAFYENVRVYECGEFIDYNLKHESGEYYCLLCGNHFERFKSGGEDFEIFKRYHIVGGGVRKNYSCPICSAIDRERWIHKVLSEKTGIYTDSCRVLHFAPESKIKERIKQNQQCDYYDADIEMGRAAHAVDMTDIPFQDDTFDYIIANHVLEHIQEEEKALLELKRVLKEKGKLILSFPICKDKKTEEDRIGLSEQDKILRFGQKDHVRLYGTDYKERLENRGLRCSFYSPEDSLTKVQIEKYGLISEDVCIICEK